MKKIFFITIIFVSLVSQAQVFLEKGALLHLQENSGLYVAGNFESHENISGEGIIYFHDEKMQQINMHGSAVPGIYITNRSGVSLSGNMHILRNLELSDAYLQLNGYDLELGVDASVAAHEKAGIITNGSGVVRKYIRENMNRYYLPLATGNSPAPVLLTSSGRYGHAFVEVSAVDEPSRHKPADAEQFLQQHWRISQSGINGKLSAEARYKISATTNLQPYVWNDRAWSTANEKVSETGVIRATLADQHNELYAMYRPFNPFNIKTNSLTPNPALYSTKLVVESNTETRGQLMVTDVRGKIVQARTVELKKGLNQFNINIAHLANGYYDVTVLTSGKKTSLKLVKQ